MRIALRAIKGHALRSALAMLGIIIGVAAVIAMAAIGYGAQKQVTDRIRSLGTNVALVSPGIHQCQWCALECRLAGVAN